MSTVGSSLDIFCRGFLKELSQEYEVVALSSPDEALSAVAKREGVKAVGVKMHRRISPLSDIVSLLRLIRVFRKERPDILHTMTPKAGLLGMMAAKISGVPIRIHSFTGLHFPTVKGVQQKLLMLTDSLTCACATHINPEGEGVKNDLLKYHITKKPLKVIGNGNVRGIDIEHYKITSAIRSEAVTIRNRFHIPQEAKLFVFIGRFVNYKGVSDLIKAFQLLGRTDCHLILVGDIDNGPYDIQYSEFQDIPHIHNSGGWVKDVRPWLASADIFVFPSYLEGFPNVVLEAGAMELPSIVTDINGSREIITDGQNGLVVPPGNVKALADAMRTLADTPSESLKAIGKAARKNVIAKYTQDFVRNCVKEYYRQIINDRLAD